MGHTNTLACVLRETLESESDYQSFTACVRPHPLDEFLVVSAKSEQAVRHALLTVKQKIQAVRNRVSRSHRTRRV